MYARLRNRNFILLSCSSSSCTLLSLLFTTLFFLFLHISHISAYISPCIRLHLSHSSYFFLSLTQCAICVINAVHSFQEILTRWIFLCCAVWYFSFSFFFLTGGANLFLWIKTLTEEKENRCFDGFHLTHFDILLYFQDVEKQTQKYFTSKIGVASRNSLKNLKINSYLLKSRCKKALVRKIAIIVKWRREGQGCSQSSLLTTLWKMKNKNTFTITLWSILAASPLVFYGMNPANAAPAEDETNSMQRKIKQSYRLCVCEKK